MLLRIKSFKESINALVLFIVFVLLDITYIVIIGEGFDYMGFEIVQSGPLLGILAYSIAIVVIYFVYRNKYSAFTAITLNLIALLFVFPAIILFKNMQSDIQILLAQLLFFFSTYFSLKYLNFRIKGRQLKMNQRSITLFLIAALMIIPFILTFKTDINLNNLLLKNVYETRSAHSELKNIYHDYTYSWLARIIIPLALIYSMREGAKFKSLILFVLLLYLFLIGAHKSVFLGTLVVLAVYFIPKQYMQLSISFAVSFILLMGMVLFLLFEDPFFASLITRRVFFVPALLDTYYFDFFDNKFLYWSESILSPILDYPYTLSPSYLIGYEYFNNPEMSANNGIISDGYANLGWVGIILNIIIISTVLSFFNSLNISHKFMGAFILFMISVLSSSLSVILVTHGGIVLLILSQFILKDTDDRFNNLASVKRFIV